MPALPGICASTTLGNLKWQIEPSTQYLHVHFNESSNSYNSVNTTGSYCLKNRQTCSKSHHLYIICSKCLPPVQTLKHRRWCHVANSTLNSSMIQICSLVLDASIQFVHTKDLITRWGRTFRANDVNVCFLEHAYHFLLKSVESKKSWKVFETRYIQQF